MQPNLNQSTGSLSKNQIIYWDEDGRISHLSPQARHVVQVACEYADRFTDPETGIVGGDEHPGPDTRSSLYCAIAFLLSGEPKRVEAGKELLKKIGSAGGHFNMMAEALALAQIDPLLDDEDRENFHQAIRGFIDSGGEDIMAGRNINIPLGNWTGRIMAGVMFNRQDHVERGIEALEKLTDMVTAHGTIPEFNSPTYHPVTLILLRIICLFGEERTIRLAEKLERHLWSEMAWRWHPRVKQLCGPWSRAYHDSLFGGSGIVLMLADMMWGAFYDKEVAYDYEHGHDHAYGGILPLLAHRHPVDVSDIALRKKMPVTVTASAEQAMVKLGNEDVLTWIPGGIADLTTWMDDNLSVGTASQAHVHGMQNGNYIAQWTRTGKPVEKLLDLGQAFTRFVQNGKRPGTDVRNLYQNHHHGGNFDIGPKLWGDDGRPFAMQSGPTALVIYLPKRQERWTVQTLEAFMVFPRLNTIDDVIINGIQSVDTYEGAANGTVIVRSGHASMGLRFVACDTELTTPKLVVERQNDHLFVGLRLIEFPDMRELSESTYRRYGATIGAELRYTPEEQDVGKLIEDLSTARLTDQWEMATFGGPQEVEFQIGTTQLYGRFEPISESWLRREVTDPIGDIRRIQFTDYS